MASLHFRITPGARVLLVHDMWTLGAKLEKGDLDDILNCFYMAEQCDRLTIYVTNDTGDGRRCEAFNRRYGDNLRAICPRVVIVTGKIDLSCGIHKVILCAPIHPEHDAELLGELRKHRLDCKYYAQGDSPTAYNMTGSAITPYIQFGPYPTLSVVDAKGIERKVPIALYNTAATNRKFTLDQLRKFAPDYVVQDVVIYGKHKLCFLPQFVYAIGLLMKKYGTGNTAYGLCHTLNLMPLEDTRDPDVVITEYLRKYGEGHVERVLEKYPAVRTYVESMKEKGAGKLDNEADMAMFKRAITLVVECTILWFGEKALDRFRTLADDDVVASITGTEKYSTSMFDLIVGVAVLNDISPGELPDYLPGTANQLATGRLLALMGL